MEILDKTEQVELINITFDLSEFMDKSLVSEVITTYKDLF